MTLDTYLAMSAVWQDARLSATRYVARTAASSEVSTTFVENPALVMWLTQPRQQPQFGSLKAVKAPAGTAVRPHPAITRRERPERLDGGQL